MWRKWRNRLLITGILACVLPLPSHAVSIHFGPAPVNLVAGDTFTVDLHAAIGASEQILGWDVDLLFDTSFMAFKGVSYGSDWGLSGAVSDNDISIGALAAFGLPPGQGVFGNVLLASLTFEVLGSGFSTLDIGVDDFFEGFQLASFPGRASWSSTPTTVNWIPVPEPGTFLLLSVGFLGLVVFRKKINRA